MLAGETVTEVIVGGGGGGGGLPWLPQPAVRIIVRKQMERRGKERIAKPPLCEGVSLRSPALNREGIEASDRN